MKTQKEVFEQIKDIAKKVQNLSGIVQNDFESMIDEEWGTVDGLISALKGGQSSIINIRKELADVHYHFSELSKSVLGRKE